MQAAELHKLVKDPSGLRETHIVPLQELTREYPYFQSAQVLLCMALRKWDTTAYQNQLKKTAIVCSDRKRLHQIIRAIEEDLLKEPQAEQEAKQRGPSWSPDPSVEEEISILDDAANPAAAVGYGEQRQKAIEKEQAAVDAALLEAEIRKQAAVAVVDKEIIRVHEQEQTGTTVTEESAEPQKPLGHEPGSFGDWLSQLKKNPEDPGIHPDYRKAAVKQQEKEDKPVADGAAERKRKQQAIIDKIIEKSPGAIRPKEDQKFFTPERTAKESLLENEHLVTETLAKIYALQGNTAKAIRSYEILSLKYPQKSTYFASLIQKLKQNQ